LMQHSVWVVG